MVYCLACYIPVSPVHRHRVVLIVSRHPSLYLSGGNSCPPIMAWLPTVFYPLERQCYTSCHLQKDIQVVKI